MSNQNDKPAPYEWIYADINGASRPIGLIQGNRDVMIATGDGSSAWLDFAPAAKTMIANAVNQRKDYAEMATEIEKLRAFIQMINPMVNWLRKVEEIAERVYQERQKIVSEDEFEPLEIHNLVIQLGMTIKRKFDQPDIQSGLMLLAEIDRQSAGAGEASDMKGGV